MNAARPVFQAQPSPDAAQLNLTASVPAASNRDFAGALDEADSRPARQNGDNKANRASPSGGQLPVVGNPSPPAASPVPPSTQAAAQTPPAEGSTASSGRPDGTAAVAATPSAAQKGRSKAANPTLEAWAVLAQSLQVAAGAAPAASVAPATLSGADASAAVSPLADGASPTPQAALQGLAAPGSSAAAAVASDLKMLSETGATVPTVPAAPSPASSSTPVSAPAPTFAQVSALAPSAGIAALSSTLSGAITAAASIPHAHDPESRNAATMHVVAGLNTTPAATDVKAAAARDKAVAQNEGTAQSDAASAKGTAAQSDLAVQTSSAATTGSDLAAQLGLAGMLRGSGARSDTPAGADASAPPAVGAATLDAASASPMPASPMAIALASGPAATAAAAKVASNAQAIAALAGDGVADRHAHVGGADSAVPTGSIDGPAGAAQLMTSASPPTQAAPAPTLNVAASVDSNEFGQGVADRVSLMMAGNLSSAKLQVNPPALGPIEVKIALQGGHAQVWFTSHSAVTRDALESSSPKLREMLGAQGFGQVSVDISQRSFQDRAPPSKGYEPAAAIAGPRATGAAQQSTAPTRIANGLLDAYA